MAVALEIMAAFPDKPVVEFVPPWLMASVPVAALTFGEPPDVPPVSGKSVIMKIALRQAPSSC